MDQYLRPTTLEEAWRLHAAHPGARYVAGATDLLVRRKRPALARVPALISLRAIGELGAITADRGAAGGGWLRIGACAPLAEVGRHPAVVEALPALAAAIRDLGTPQIRNVATLGGNLGNASPCADSAPPLLVYDAVVELAGPGGRRELPLDQLFRGPGATVLGPGELIAAVRVPWPAPAFHATYLCKGRVATDLSMASLALGVEVAGGRCVRARVAAGAVAPTPLRLRAIEALLAGADLGDRAVVARARAAACAAVLPITDIRATADYRRHLIGVFCERALAEVA
jgi:carbon-monoxide dehydrogenase medium subunit